MDATAAYTLLTSLYLTLSALPHLLTPSLTVALLTPSPRASTELETHLSHSLALALLALALLSLLHSGLIPLSSVAEESESESPFRVPTLVVTALYHAAGFVGGYVEFTALGPGAGSGGSSGVSGGGGVPAGAAGPRAFLALGMVCSGVLATWGGWCLMFDTGVQAGGRSKVSGWPFRNEEERNRKREKMMARKMGKGQ